MIARSLVAALVAATLPALALPAAAEVARSEPAQRLVDMTLSRGLIAQGDWVWLEPTSRALGPRDQDLLDALTSALLARKVMVMRDTASSDRGALFADRIASLKRLGITKILSVTEPDAEGRLAFRIVDPTTGLVKTVEATAPLPPVVVPVATPSVVVATPSAPVEVVNPEPQGLGVGYSTLSGSGLTYRKWWQNGWGIQLAGVPLVSISSNQPTGVVNVGLQLMAPIAANDRFRLFWLVGTGAAYQQYQDYSGSGTYMASRLDLGAAPGIGADWRLFSNLVLTGSVGYTFSRTTTNGANPQLGLNPGGSMGALLYW